MDLAHERIYTVDDIYALPDGQRAELIDGQMYMMAPPNTKHQRIVGNLYAAIHHYIKAKGGSCEVFPAPFAVFLNKDSKNYVEPDITVICDKDKLDDVGCNGAPDWVIEVVSPSDPQRDYDVKLFKYRTAGVREYWIVDSRRKNVTVNYFEGNLLNIQYSFEATIKVNIYDDLYINFAEIAELLSM